MRKVMTNILLISCISFIWIISSIVLSFYTKDFSWFSRSGPILVLCGTALAIRPLLRMGLEKYIAYLNTIDGGHVEPTPEELEAERQQRLDVKSSIIGFYFIVFGTLIGAYGDLLKNIIYNT